MFPVILQLGGFSITSFGLFLSIALLCATFSIWRLAKIYDIDKEKILDLVILTFFGGFIGARVLYIILNYPDFNEINKIILINRYPGFSLWGGVILGILVLWYFSKRSKISLWLILDLASVGFFIAASLGSIGCFLSACQYGVSSKLPFAVLQIGLVGKRFPVQIFYSLFYLISFFYLWRACIKYHFEGKIVAVAFMIMGVINFLLEFARGDTRIIFGIINLNHLLSLGAFLTGFIIYYSLSKRSFIKDLKKIASLFSDAEVRKETILSFYKSWYNIKVNFKFNLIEQRKKLGKLLNVKSNPTKF